MIEGRYSPYVAPEKGRKVWNDVTRVHVGE